jgi:hypothetical protein
MCRDEPWPHPEQGRRCRPVCAVRRSGSALESARLIPPLRSVGGQSSLVRLPDGSQGHPEARGLPCGGRDGYRQQLRPCHCAGCASSARSPGCAPSAPRSSSREAPSHRSLISRSLSAGGGRDALTSPTREVLHRFARGTANSPARANHRRDDERGPRHPLPCRRLSAAVLDVVRHSANRINAHATRQLPRHGPRGTTSWAEG